MTFEVDIPDMDLTKATPQKPASTLIFWFRARNDKVFHAYRSRKLGEPSVCGHGSQIINVSEMDSGGSYSKCCIHCFRHVNGINLSGRRK